MPLKMHKFTATLIVEGQVEAESFDEAERIAEGCIAAGHHVQITELSVGDEPEGSMWRDTPKPDGSNIIDQMCGTVVRADVKIEP